MKGAINSIVWMADLSPDGLADVRMKRRPVLVVEIHHSFSRVVDGDLPYG
jgi:hypothetical protein